MNVGLGTEIYNGHLSNIHRNVDFGKGCTIHSHVWIGDGVTIGQNTKIQAFAFIPQGVTIGKNVFIGPHVCFTNDKHPPSHGKGWKPIVVKDGASIGARAVILPDVTIGEKAVIGAGAVVTKDVPDGATWVGNPARSLTKEQ